LQPQPTAAAEKVAVGAGTPSDRFHLKKFSVETNTMEYRSWDMNSLSPRKNSAETNLME
jgi:hypothetical protein